MGSSDREGGHPIESHLPAFSADDFEAELHEITRLPTYALGGRDPKAISDHSCRASMSELIRLEAELDGGDVRM